MHQFLKGKTNYVICVSVHVYLIYCKFISVSNSQINLYGFHQHFMNAFVKSVTDQPVPLKVAVTLHSLIMEDLGVEVLSVATGGDNTSGISIKTITKISNNLMTKVKLYHIKT